jgi:hypothetical protein
MPAVRVSLAGPAKAQRLVRRLGSHYLRNLELCDLRGRHGSSRSKEDADRDARHARNRDQSCGNDDLLHMQL